MIFLTQKAAKRFSTPWKECIDLSDEGEGWKVDVQMYFRTPLLIITHSKTLYTLVRRKRDIPTLAHLIQEIEEICPWFQFKEPHVIGKNANRQLSGSMNEMKWIIDCNSVEYSKENYLEEMERQINSFIFSQIAYDTPTEAVQKSIS